MSVRELYLGPRGPFPTDEELENGPKKQVPTGEYNAEMQAQGFELAQKRRVEEMKVAKVTTQRPLISVE